MKMVMYGTAVVLVGAALTVGIQSFSIAENSFSRGEIEQIVEEYIEQNPETIVNSVSAWQERQAQAQQKEKSEAAKELSQTLADDASIPSMGAKEGNPVIIEFFDYNCPYCKTSFSALNKLVKENSDVKVKLIEYPIFGEESRKISSIALAVYAIKPEKYNQFHSTLMNIKGRISSQKAREIALSLGIDAKMLDETTSGDAVTAQLKKNHALAQQLEIRGTPAFIIGGQFIGGALGYDRLKLLVAEQTKQ